LNYGNKRACNKRIGPGGGTRRLHQFLGGRNRIDGRLKMLAFTRRDCHRYRRKNNNCKWQLCSSSSCCL